MLRILNNLTAVVLILVILCVQSLSTISILQPDCEVQLIELIELTEEAEESSESDEKSLEEDLKDFFVSNFIKHNNSFGDLDGKFYRFICLYKSLCLDIKGAPPDLN